MSWRTLYDQRLSTAADAVQVIHSQSAIFLTGNCSVPQRLLDALVERARAGEVEDVQINQILTIGNADYVDPALQGRLRVNTLFISENVRGAVNAGRADYTPCFLGEVPKLFREKLIPLDVALVHCSPPDEHGFCSFGVEVGLTKPAAESARVVIAEINDHMPRTLGNSFIHISKLSHIVPVSYPLPEVTVGAPGLIQKQIAAHIAELIPDGATLQMGIGGIPDAVLLYLRDKRDLGIHTEMFSDGVIGLIDAGVINNERKTLHRGKVVAGFILGSRSLYNYVHDNPIFEFHPQDYVNDPFVIAANEQMIAINSAIEVDLTGQVCADSIGHRFYSGVGGQVDFVRGATRSKGGKPIIALPSTAKQDTISRIVPALKPGAGVVTSRHDVHYVVTEYGVANLYGRSIRQRVQALIAIAHPHFRKDLTAFAQAQNYI